jgi:KUP system potassium uptake protein
MVGLATLAAIIASQATISSAFSITRQAVQLGYWPRLDIRHTSARERGQIYVPHVNWALAAGTILTVLAFRSSTALASAYGVAVSGTILITSVLLFLVATRRWGWHPLLAGLVVGFFLVLEATFFAANLVKVLEGGWFPLALAVGILLLMVTWRDGRRLLADRLKERSVLLEEFLDQLRTRAPTRVRGNAVYMTGNPRWVPPALLKNLEHNRVLHMQVVVLSIVTEDVPFVAREHRVTLEPLRSGFYVGVARFGFMEHPDAVDVLRQFESLGLHLPLEETTFFLGRERLISTKRPGMARWRERVFAFMSRNAQPANAYFKIPPERVIEVGSQIEL